MCLSVCVYSTCTRNDIGPYLTAEDNDKLSVVPKTSDLKSFNEPRPDPTQIIVSAVSNPLLSVFFFFFPDEISHFKLCLAL